MEYLHIPSKLDGFHNTDTTVELSKSGRTVYLLHGELARDGERPQLALNAAAECTCTAAERPRFATCLLAMPSLPQDFSG